MCQCLLTQLMFKCHKHFNNFEDVLLVFKLVSYGIEAMMSKCGESIFKQLVTPFLHNCDDFQKANPNLIQS